MVKFNSQSDYRNLAVMYKLVQEVVNLYLEIVKKLRHNNRRLPLVLDNGYYVIIGNCTPCWVWNSGINIQNWTQLCLIWGTWIVLECVLLPIQYLFKHQKYWLNLSCMILNIWHDLNICYKLLYGRKLEKHLADLANTYNQFTKEFTIAITKKALSNATISP